MEDSKKEEAGIEDIFDLRPPIDIQNLPDGRYAARISSMPINFQLAKYPYSFSPFPESFLAPIGAVLVQWGAFEERHNFLLEALRGHNSSQATRVNGFERNRRALKDEIKRAFGEAPVLRCHLSEILGRAKTLQESRSLIAHGALQLSVQKKSGDGPMVKLEDFQVAISASGFKNNNPITRDFSMLALRSLFYDLGHLTGLISEIGRRDGLVPHLPSSEKEILAEFQRKALPQLPILDMRPAPTPSSQG